jgi:hypothetical protein
VAKYDPDGVLQWTQQLGSQEREYGTDIVANDFGEVFVTGFTSGSLGSENVGAEDVWAAKLDADSGKIGKFSGKIKGGNGKLGEEPEEIDSLEDIFDPNEEFADSFGEAINDNSDDLIFEDETGEELSDDEIEEIEGIDGDSQSNS